MTDKTPTMLVAIIADRDQTITALRALLKSKDDEIADLKRDRSRLQGRIDQQEQRAALDAWFPS